MTADRVMPLPSTLAHPDPAWEPPALSGDPFIAATQLRVMADAAEQSLVWHTLVPAPADKKQAKR